VLLHRQTASAASARAALEAAGLAVQDTPIGTGGLSRNDLAVLAAGRSDALWLYLVPNGADAGAPGGNVRFALDDVLVIAQELVEYGAAGPSLRVVTSGSQSIGSTSRPGDASVWGIGRVLATEAPDARVSFVDMDAGGTSGWDGLARIIASGNGEAELALRDGNVFAPALVPIELPAQTSDSIVSRDGSYIVTGAFGFIGELTTLWLTGQRAGKLFLVGRNPPRTPALAAIEAARAAGTDVEIVLADIGAAAGADVLFERVAADARPLKGIIHSAAALDDAAISRQTPESFSVALGAKAMGAWLLHERSLGYSLDFFVLYSSAAALLGSPGQSNYAAANCYLGRDANNGGARHGRSGTRHHLRRDAGGLHAA
jgi:hypothetical protein